MAEEKKVERNTVFLKAIDRIKADPEKTIPLSAAAFIAFKTADNFANKAANPNLEKLLETYSKVTPEQAHVHTVSSMYESFIITLFATFLATPEELEEMKNAAGVVAKKEEPAPAPEEKSAENNKPADAEEIDPVKAEA